MTLPISSVSVRPSYAGVAARPGAAFVGAFLTLGVALLVAAVCLLTRRCDGHPRYSAPRR